MRGASWTTAEAGSLRERLCTYRRHPMAPDLDVGDRPYGVSTIGVIVVRASAAAAETSWGRAFTK